MRGDPKIIFLFYFEWWTIYIITELIQYLFSIYFGRKFWRLFTFSFNFFICYPPASKVSKDAANLKREQDRFLSSRGGLVRKGIIFSFSKFCYFCERWIKSRLRTTIPAIFMFYDILNYLRSWPTPYLEHPHQKQHKMDSSKPLASRFSLIRNAFLCPSTVLFFMAHSCFWFRTVILL